MRSLPQTIILYYYRYRRSRVTNRPTDSRARHSSRSPAAASPSSSSSSSPSPHRKSTSSVAPHSPSHSPSSSKSYSPRYAVLAGALLLPLLFFYCCSISVVSIACSLHCCVCSFFYCNHLHPSLSLLQIFKHYFSPKLTVKCNSISTNNRVVSN